MLIKLPVGSCSQCLEVTSAAPKPGAYLTVYCGNLSEQKSEYPIPITIRVVDPFKTPIAGACVTTGDASHRFKVSQVTDPAGSVPIALAAGSYDITATSPGFSTTTSHLVVSKDSPPSFAIKMAVGTTSGLPVTSAVDFSKLLAIMQDPVCPPAPTRK